ncbi:Spore germination protein gerPA/gerPF [Bacillus sp. OV322]|uniref:spore germination protein n=1 Tax=Bacillus sp. OV322 TaxID=1882764 RepID=UPI0008E1934B|nr:spore germination protein [Bacillus sp. OV322]SFC77265.1 Spore germination protein gerPA/gerPF [Bacillus sp. OV322]
MPQQINIFNIKTNSITTNANFDIGPTVHNSHTSNFKIIGANFSFGDISPAGSSMANGVWDPDFSDQDQIANPSMPITSQL